MNNQNSNYEWKNIYIFISSTFNDMHAERDYLIKNVFPELSVWCNQRMLKLVDIDLRWGITEEDSKINKRVVDICLNRIDDCRPFFLCFLGQRRGWIPKREDVSEETVNRQGIEEVLGKDSVTEMEIRHAVLQPFWDHKTEEMGVPVNNAFFFFRDNKYLDDIKDRPELIKIFTNAGETNEKAADDAIIKSKTEIIEMCKRHNHAKPVIYEATWDNSLSSPELKLSSANDKQNEERCKGRLSDFKASGVELKNTVISLLKEAIIKEYPERAHIGSVMPEGLKLELLEQSEFINTNFEGYIKRKGDFETLNDYINSTKNNLLAVTAEAGLGKTTLIANWILELLEKNKDYNICYRFVGASNRTDTISHILESIIEELKSKDLLNLDDSLYSDGEEILDSGEKIKLYFCDILATLTKNTIIVIDGLNQLSDELESSSYLWLPSKLPHTAKFVVSFKSGQGEKQKFIEFLEEERKASLLKIEPFTDISERKKLIEEYLSKNLKSLDDEKLNSLLSIEATKNPLFLKIVLSELRVYGSFETLLNKIINDFGSSPKDAFISVLKRLEEDPAYCKLNPKLAVSSIFGLISASRNGLEISELTDSLIKITKNQMSKIDIEDSIHLYLRQLRPFLARRENRVDFLYEAFALAAKEKYSEKEEFFHEILSSVFRDKADINNNKQWEGTQKRAFQELPYHLSLINSQNDYKELLLDYTWLCNKLKLFKDDVRQVINDFKYNFDSAELNLLCHCIEQSENILKQDHNQLPVQLWGRLSEIDNKYIFKLLNQSVDETKYVWLRPERAVLGDVRNGIIGSYEGKARHMHKLYSYKNRIIAVGYFHIDIWDTDLHKIIYSIDIEHCGSERNTINMEAIESSLMGNKLTVKTSYNIFVWNVDNGENLLTIGLSDEEFEQTDEDEYGEYIIENFYSYEDSIVVIYNDYFSVVDIKNSKSKIVFPLNNTENEHSLIGNYFIIKNNSELMIWNLDNFENIINVDAAADEKIESYDLYEDNLYIIKSVKQNINNKKVFKKAFIEILNIKKRTKDILQLDNVIKDYDSFFNEPDYSEDVIFADEDLIADYITLLNISVVKNNIIIYNSDIYIIDSSSYKTKCSLHGEYHFVHKNKIYYYDYENKILAYDLETQKTQGSYDYRPKDYDNTFYCVEDCLFTYHDFQNDKPWMNIWNTNNNKWIGTIFGGHCQTFVKDDKIIAINETDLFIIEKESGILLNNYDILFINSLIIAGNRVYCAQESGSISIVDLNIKKEIISSTKDYISNLRYMNKKNGLIYCADDEYIRIYDGNLKNEIKNFSYGGHIEKLSLNYPYFIALTSSRKYGEHNEYVPESKLDNDYFIKKLEDENPFNINMWNVETDKSFEHSMKLKYFPSLFTYENYIIIEAKSTVSIYNMNTDKCVFQYKYKNSQQYINCCEENVFIGDGEILYIYSIIKNKIILSADLFNIFKNLNKDSGKYDAFTEYKQHQNNKFASSFDTWGWVSAAEQERFHLDDFSQDNVFIYNNYLIIKLNDKIKVLNKENMSELTSQELTPSASYECNEIYLKGKYLITFSNGEVSIRNLDTLKLVDNYEMLNGQHSFTWETYEFKEFLIFKVDRETRIWNKNTEECVRIFSNYDLIKQEGENLYFQDLENFDINIFNMKEDKLSNLSSLRIMEELIDIQDINDYLVLLEYKRSKVIYNVTRQKIESVNISSDENRGFSSIWDYNKVQSLKVGEHFYFNGNGYNKYKIEGDKHGTK